MLRKHQTTPPPKETQETEMAHKKPETTDAPNDTPQSDESLIDAIHDGQETVVTLAKDLVDGVGEVVPEFWSRPIAAGIPAIQELTDAAFSMTRGIVDAQFDFAKRVMDSVTTELKRLE
jgi:hypothetical protein